MRRRFPGLHQTAGSAEIPYGLYFVQVERLKYRWSARKPFYTIRLRVIEPKPLGGASIEGRLYLSEKALWKLAWFLHDFGYDAELLGRDELDEKALIGLTGVVKISHVVVHGASLLNLDAFAPAAEWQKLSAAIPKRAPEVA